MNIEEIKLEMSETIWSPLSTRNKVDSIMRLIKGHYVKKTTIEKKIEDLEERNKYLYTNGDINKNSFETIENEVKIKTLKELL